MCGEQTVGLPRYVMEKFTLKRLNGCRAKLKKDKNFSVIGHYGEVCRKPLEQQNIQKQALRWTNWEHDESDKNDEQARSEQNVLAIYWLEHDHS